MSLVSINYYNVQMMTFIFNTIQYNFLFLKNISGRISVILLRIEIFNCGQASTFG